MPTKSFKKKNVDKQKALVYPQAGQPKAKPKPKSDKSTANTAQTNAQAVAAEVKRIFSKVVDRLAPHPHLEHHIRQHLAGVSDHGPRPRRCDPEHPNSALRFRATTKKVVTLAGNGAIQGAMCQPYAHNGLWTCASMLDAADGAGGLAYYASQTAAPGRILLGSAYTPNNAELDTSGGAGVTYEEWLPCQWEVHPQSIPGEEVQFLGGVLIVTVTTTTDCIAQCGVLTVDNNPRTQSRADLVTMEVIDYAGGVVENPDVASYRTVQIQKTKTPATGLESANLYENVMYGKSPYIVPPSSSRTFHIPLAPLCHEWRTVSQNNSSGTSPFHLFHWDVAGTAYRTAANSAAMREYIMGSMVGCFVAKAIGTGSAVVTYDCRMEHAFSFGSGNASNDSLMQLSPALEVVDPVPLLSAGVEGYGMNAKSAMTDSIRSSIAGAQGRMHPHHTAFLQDITGDLVAEAKKNPSSGFIMQDIVGQDMYKGTGPVAVNSTFQKTVGAGLSWLGGKLEAGVKKYGPTILEAGLGYAASVLAMI